jgi:hypothetical protein
MRESPAVDLIKWLIAEGREVRIFDPEVSRGRLLGANRRYIENELPHFSALLCEHMSDLIDHAQVLVVLHDDAYGAAALVAARPGQVVIDLTKNAKSKTPVMRVIDGAYATALEPGAAAAERPFPGRHWMRSATYPMTSFMLSSVKSCRWARRWD